MDCFFAVTNLLKTVRNTYALSSVLHAITCLIEDSIRAERCKPAISYDLPLPQVNRDVDDGGGSGEVEGVPRAVPEVDGEELAEEGGRLP